MSYRKWKWIQRTSIILIIAAIALLVYPIIANLLADQKRSEAVGNYDASVGKMAEKQLAQNLKDAEIYNQNLFEAQQNGLITTIAKAYQDVMKDNTVMGTLDIPAIDIKHMPFYHGTDEHVLLDGLGHIGTTSLPVGGKNTHAVITGHSGIQNQKLFSDINKLQKGDAFYITIYKRRLMYRVRQIQVIDPQDVDKVKIEAGEDKVTLLTCTPAGINTHRLLVTGYREIPYQGPEKIKVVKRNFWNYEHMVILLLAILVLLIMVGAIFKRRRGAR